MASTDTLPIIPIPPTQPRKKSNVNFEEEEIVVKPSTELIPDEYEHFSNENVLVHIFTTEDDQDLTNKLFDTMKNINYNLNKTHHIHPLDTKLGFMTDLQSIKRESTNKSALIIILFGYFQEDSDDGSFIVVNDDSDNTVHIKTVWNYFSSDKCLELKNKPKIFIFCTSKLQRRLQVETDKKHRSMLLDKAYEFPAESDILIVYKKTDDIRNQLKEKYLSQLCENIRKHSKTFDIVDLASYTEKSTPPLIISTLTRKFYLTPSNERGQYLSIVENNEKLENALKKIKDNIQKLHDLENKKKKERKFFSFRKKNDEKPKIARRETSKGESSRTSRISESSTARASAPTRSRHQSVTDYDNRRPSGASVKKEGTKRPIWRF